MAPVLREGEGEKTVEWGEENNMYMWHECFWEMGKGDVSVVRRNFWHIELLVQMGDRTENETTMKKRQ